MPIRGHSKFDAKLARLQRTLVSVVPKRVAAVAERHFKESFRQQGFTDSSFSRWRPTKNGKANRTLKKSGRLMNSVRVAHATWNRIQVVAGGQHVPYAKIHNEGGTIHRQATRRAHFRKKHMANTRRGTVMRNATMVRRHQVMMNTHIPKRQFMGRSRAMELKMRSVVLKSIQTVMQ